MSDTHNEDVIVFPDDNDDFDFAEEDAESHTDRLNSSSEFQNSGPEKGEEVPEEEGEESEKRENPEKSPRPDESVEMDTSAPSVQQSGKGAKGKPSPPPPPTTESLSMEDVGGQVTTNGQGSEEPMDTAPLGSEGVKEETEKSPQQETDENKKDDKEPEDDTKQEGGDDGHNTSGEAEEMQESEGEEEGEEEEAGEKKEAESGEEEEEESGDEESEDTSNDSADESVSSSEESGQRSVSSRGSGKRKRPLAGSTDSERARAKIPKTGKSSRSRERKPERSDRKSGKLCAEDGKMEFYFKETRYFQIKSGNQENVMLSKARGVWATTSRNEANINKAFRESRNVILIFSVERSQRFQGFARVAAESSRAHSPVNWVLPIGFNARNLGGIFKLHWINRLDLPFAEVGGLSNPLNDNKPVKIARDGTELTPEIGRKLCSKFPVDDGVDLGELEKKVKRLQETHPYGNDKPGTGKRYSATSRSAAARGRDGGGGPPRRGRGASRSPPPARSGDGGGGSRSGRPLSGSNVAPLASSRQSGGSSGGRSGGGGGRHGGGDRHWPSPRRYSGGRDPPYHNGYYDAYDRSYGGGYPYSMGGYGGYPPSGPGIPSLVDWGSSYPAPVPPHGPQPLMGVPTSRYGSYSYGGQPGGGGGGGRDRAPRTQPPSAYSDPYKKTSRRSHSPPPPPPRPLMGSSSSSSRGGRGDRERDRQGDRQGARPPSNRRRKQASSSSGGSRSPPQAYKSSSGGGNSGPKKRPETPPRYRKQKERIERSTRRP